MDRRILAITFLASIIITSSFAVPGAFAQKTSDDQDEINGPGGLMSLTGIGHTTAPTTNNPLQIKEHHPAHVKKFIGHSVSLSGGDAPVAVYSAYGFNKLSCSQTTTTDWTDPNLCGHGQTIAIVDAYDDPNAASDLATFDTQFGLPACTVANGCFVKSAPSGIQSNSGWDLEISLDVQWAHSIAPGAKIVLVESSDNSLGNLLGGVSTAVGTGAQQVSNSWGGNEFSSESSYDSYFNSPSASFFVASGDSGHGVEWPAASPYVIAVGGTTLNLDSSGNWLSETAWSGSSGGLSAYESKPSYQNNFVSGSQRAVPDVSYDGNPNTGVYVFDSIPINGQSGWWIVGGTSAGAPQWAGISAIANSQGAKLASASFGTSTALYGAAVGAQSNPQTSPYVSNYHDITSGSNGNCGSLCNTSTGYDEVTGLGSPQSNNLIPYLNPTPTPDFTIFAHPTSLTVASGGSGTSTITVTSVNGFTGIIGLSVSPSSGASLGMSSLKIPTAGGSNSTTLTLTPTSSGTYSVTGSSGSLTHIASVFVTVETAPSAPQNLQATAGNQQVSLSWQAPSSNGGLPITYTVFRNGTQLASGISNTIYTDTGLTNGDTDSYYVEAVNSVGSSNSSNTVSAMPLPTPTLSVSVSPNKSSYSPGSTAYITVTVTSGTTHISGASVTLTVKAPNGTTSQASSTTNSNGQVVFGYHLPRHAQAGTYTASASASNSGYLSGSGSATFSVT